MLSSSKSFWDIPKTIVETIRNTAPPRLNSVPFLSIRNRRPIKSARWNWKNPASRTAIDHAPTLSRPVHQPNASARWISHPAPTELGPGRWNFLRRSSRITSRPTSQPMTHTRPTFRANTPAWLNNPASFRNPVRVPWMPAPQPAPFFSQPRYHANANSLVQAMSTFKPAFSAATRWPSFNRWSASQHRNGPSWLTIPR